MASSAKLTFGKRPAATVLDKLSAALKPTNADLLHAGNVLKSRIVERTARGVDWQNRPFAPYSTKGPYYFYPNGAVGRKGSLSSRKGSASRLQKKIGGTLTRSRVGVKFDSYAAFKAALGRSGVDLTGPRAPHMLQGIVVQGQGDTITVAIYGDEASRARGNNEGIPGRLPQRKFFAASPEDKRVMLLDMQERRLKRAKDVIG